MPSFIAWILLFLWAKADIIFEGNSENNSSSVVLRLACRENDAVVSLLQEEGKLMTITELHNLLTSKSKTSLGMANLGGATPGERKAFIKILEGGDSPLPEPLINQLTMAELAQLPIVSTIMSIDLDNLEQIKAIFRLADNDRAFLLEAQRILKPKHTQKVPMADAETVLNLCNHIETSKPKISGGSLRGGPVDLLLTKYLTEEAVKLHQAKTKREIFKMNAAFGLERNPEADQKLASFRESREAEAKEIANKVRARIHGLLPDLNGGPAVFHSPVYTAQDFCPELFVGPEKNTGPQRNYNPMSAQENAEMSQNTIPTQSLPPQLLPNLSARPLRSQPAQPRPTGAKLRPKTNAKPIICVRFEREE